MRKVINISLPPQMVAIVKRQVKTGKYSTTSEFFRHLLREWEENNLLRELRQSQKEIKQGKGVILKSMKDLRNI